MSAVRREAVRVLVPASSANLGPAFDCAGLALGLHDELLAMPTDDDGVLVEVVGEGEGTVSRGPDNLVARGMAAGFAWLGVAPPGFVLRCANAIPHGRGLGSSAAAAIGGIVLARAMVDDGPERMPDAEVLQVALQFESHPDNLAAALWGGFTVAWLDEDGRADAVRRTPHPDVHPVVLVPGQEVLTTRARALLPASVPFGDAAANGGRCALLVHALTEEPGRLMEATRDWLHQSARRTAYPDSIALMARLREAGVPAVISGAGPSVLAFAGPELDPVVDSCRAGGAWDVARLPVAAHGAREVPLPPLA